MPISSTEYKSLVLSCLDVIPELSRVISKDQFELIVINQFDEIRLKHKKIKSEWELFRGYPRHDTSALKEAIILVLEQCEKWGIDPTFPFPNNVDLNENTWEDFRKMQYVARYFYKGIEITKIIEF